MRQTAERNVMLRGSGRGAVAWSVGPDRVLAASHAEGVIAEHIDGANRPG